MEIFARVYFLEYGTVEAIPWETADFDNRRSYFERSQCRISRRVRCQNRRISAIASVE